MKRVAIKICGIRDAHTLEVLAANQVDYAGFVLVPDSVRFVSLSNVKELAQRALALGLEPVAVITKDSPYTLDDVISVTQCLYLQLHGEFDANELTGLPEKIQLIQALPLEDETVRKLHQLPARVDQILFDGCLPGSGKPADFHLLPACEKPFFLAGGLSDENVSQLIQHCQPTAVDVSSAVESIRGIKSANKIKNFVQTVRKAEHALTVNL